jgi:hypothetical protein
MVDAVIIMIENAHKHLERDQGKKPHWEIIRDAAVEVGPTLFYSLLVITVSFLPVFTLQEQEGRLFKPLAFTKTYSMAAAALLSITLAPVLMGWFIRGKIPSEEKNPLNRLLIWIYHPVLDFVIKRRWAVIISAGAFIVWVFLPWNWIVERTRCPKAKLATRRSARENYFPSKTSARNSCRRFTKAICFTCPRRSRHLADQGARNFASHRPAHQIVSRSRGSFRQGRPRRDRHRSRADGHD